MNTLRDNKFRPASGLIEGDHLRHTASIGIHRLIERVNGALLGCERHMTVDELPGKVRGLMEQSARLAQQIEQCESIPVGMAPDYLKAQAKLAGDAQPLILAELERRQKTAAEALAGMRATLAGKSGALGVAAADAVLNAGKAAEAIEREAGLAAWRSAFAITRDTAVNKTVPRWLTMLIAAHEGEKLKAAMG